MLLRNLLCTVLSLPLAMGLNTEECLGIAFLNSLPKEMAAPGQRLKSLLDVHPCLHPDLEQIWSPSDIWLFTHVYLPLLQVFVIAAMQYPELIKEEAPPGEGPAAPSTVRLLKVGRTLECLLNFKVHRGLPLREADIFRPLAAMPGSALPLKVARASFMALCEFVARWIIQERLDLDIIVGEEGRALQAAITRSMVKIASLTRIAHDLAMTPTSPPKLHQALQHLWQR